MEFFVSSTDVQFFHLFKLLVSVVSWRRSVHEAPDGCVVSGWLGSKTGGVVKGRHG